MFVLSHARWQRVVVVALLVVPLVLLVVLMAPTLICWPLLTRERRDGVGQVLDRFVEWIKTLAETEVAPSPPIERQARDESHPMSTRRAPETTPDSSAMRGA